MKDSTKILSLLLLLVVVGTVLFVRGARDHNPSDRVWTEIGATESTDPSDPSRDNVGHNFLVEERKLVGELAASPQDTVAIRRLANFYHDAHKMDKAIDLYSQYLAIEPGSRQVWMDLANCYGAIQAWPEALAATQEVIDRWPNEFQAWYNLGAIHANAGERTNAATAWHHVMEQSQDSSLVDLARSSLAKLVGNG